MTSRIKNAIDVFLDALNNGTLAKGTCVACAVGNLVAHDIGVKIFKNQYEDFDTKNSLSWAWSNLFLTVSGKQNINFDKNSKHYKNGIKSISYTEFTIDELKRIEFVFETNTKIHYRDYKYFSNKEIFQDQLKGLEAVVKIMLTFDKQVDKVKKVFTEKAIANNKKQLLCQI